MASSTSPAKKQARPQCLVCTGNGSLHTLRILPCGHHHCDICLQGNVKASLRSKPFIPSRCCERIDIAVLSQAFSPKSTEMTEYSAMLDEFSTPNKLYCSVATCNSWIPLSSRSFRVGTCPKCSARTCKKCHSKSHWGLCPSRALRELDADKKLLELAEVKGWKQCPKCRVMVDKMSGCSFMHCRCGCEFCYACGQAPYASHVCR